MSSNSPSFQNGDCYTAYIRYQHNDGTFISGNKGKPRPVVIIQDPTDQKFYAFKVTGQVHKPFNKRNGYSLNDWNESGFNKPSIVKCNTDNRFEIDPTNLGRKFGKLTENDLRGFLTKLIKVRKLEHQNENELDR